MVFEQARALGFIYALVMFFILAYLWYTKRWTRRIAWIVLLITVALGFLIFSPIIPWQFQSLVLRDARGVGGPLAIAAAGLIVMLALSFVFGRFYCGYLCPVGAVQELASLAPVSKIKVGSKVWPGAIRWIFFILFIIAGYFFTYGLLRLFGIRDFSGVEARLVVFALRLGGLDVQVNVGQVGLDLLKPRLRVLGRFLCLVPAPKGFGARIEPGERALEFEDLRVQLLQSPEIRQGLVHKRLLVNGESGVIVTSGRTRVKP